MPGTFPRALQYHPHMTCKEFRERFSDYFDGTGDPRFVAEASTHTEACGECARYRHVVERGVGVLRDTPGPSLADDFVPRLRHRIYHLKDGPVPHGRESVGSVSTTATAIAMLIAVVAWSPALIRTPEVTIDPIVVNRPEPRVVGIRSPSYWVGPAGDPVSVMHRGLWDDPLLLTRYSPLTADTRGRSALRQVELD